MLRGKRTFTLAFTEPPLYGCAHNVNVLWCSMHVMWRRQMNVANTGLSKGFWGRYLFNGTLLQKVSFYFVLIPQKSVFLSSQTNSSARFTQRSIFIFLKEYSRCLSRVVWEHTRSVSIRSQHTDRYAFMYIDVDSRYLNLQFSIELYK